MKRPPIGKLVVAAIMACGVMSLWLASRTQPQAHTDDGDGSITLLGTHTEPLALLYDYKAKRVTITEHLPADWEVCLSLGGAKLECKPMQNWTREIPR